MVANPPLREIIGANALGAITTADLRFTLRRAFAVNAGALCFKKPCAHDLHGAGAVFMLRFFILLADGDTTWQMRYTHRAFCGVDVLPASTTGAKDINAEVFFFNLDINFCRLW